MYKKIIIVISIIFAAILFYFANKYLQVQDYKLVAVEKIEYLKTAADNFCNVGIFVSFIILILANVVSIKTKQFYWFWLPIFFIIIVAILVGYQANAIFIFSKQNGLWKGGFSVSYIASFVIIVFAIFIIGIEYLILKKVINSYGKIKNHSKD